MKTFLKTFFIAGIIMFIGTKVLLAIFHFFLPIISMTYIDILCAVFATGYGFISATKEYKENKRNK